jgi:integrase
MNYIQRELHDAKVTAAASMPSVKKGESLRIPEFTIRLRPSQYWAFFEDGVYLRSCGTKVEAEARQLLELLKLQAEADRDDIVAIRRAKATDIVDFAIRTYPKSKEKSRRVIVCVLQHVRTRVEGLCLQDLNGDWLLETEEKMIEENYAYGYFYECIARLIYAIRRYCKNRMCEAIIPFNRPPKSPGRTRVLSDAECDRALRWADGTESYDKATGTWTPQERLSKYERNCRLMVGREMRLGLSIGSRPGVYSGLAWAPNPDFGHLDIANATFHRLASGASAEERKGAPAVALSPRLLTEMKRWKLFDGAEEHVFRTMRGGPLPAQTLREIFMVAMLYLGIEGVCGHTLRHTCITRMIERGLSASVIAAICGISIDMLKRRYDHSDARVVQQIGHGVMDDLLRAAE